MPAAKPKAKAAAKAKAKAAAVPALPPDASGDEADDESEKEEPYVPPVDASDPPKLTPANRKLMAEAKSHDHLMSHKPKNPFCPACRQAKAQRKPCARGNPNAGPRPKAWCEQLSYCWSHGYFR